MFGLTEQLNLILNDREILQGAGKVSAHLAKNHAEQEFDKFHAIEDQRFESDLIVY